MADRWWLHYRVVLLAGTANEHDCWLDRRHRAESTSWRDWWRYGHCQARVEKGWKDLACIIWLRESGDWYGLRDRYQSES